MTPPQKRVVTLDNPKGDAPYVQPGVSSQAAGYAAGVNQRRGLPKTNTPVGGGPPPPIPALEQPHRAGMTMAQQANQTRGPDYQRLSTQALQAHSAAGGIIVPEAQPPPATVPVSPQDLVLLPNDALPEEAKKDPHFQRGAGSDMAQMQPHMAAKYGVIRNGQRLMPHDLVHRPMTAPSGQRPRRKNEDIARDFNSVINAPPAAPRGEASEDDGPPPLPGMPRTEEEAKEQALAGPAGAAQHAGESPTPPILDGTSEEAKERAKRLADGLDDFDYASFRREMLKDILKNPEQQKIVEARLKPLDISELIMKNSVRQQVPILPNRFIPTFESMPGGIELKLKQLLVKEAQSIAVTEAYLLDKYAVMTTTAGTVEINGTPLPTMYDSKGEFDEKRFWEKFDWMLKRNIHMLASLGIHYAWFEQRVRKLFVADAGKGG